MSKTVFNSAENTADNVQKFATNSFIVLISFAGLAILAGTCGVTCLCKSCVANRTWTFLFGFILVIIWIVFIVMGIILTAVSFNGPDVL